MEMYSGTSTVNGTMSSDWPGAAALDDDDATIIAYSGPFRFVKLHRRTSTGAWPVAAELGGQRRLGYLIGQHRCRPRAARVLSNTGGISGGICI